MKVTTEYYLVMGSNTVDYADAPALKIEAVLSSRILSNFYQTASHLYRRQTSTKFQYLPTFTSVEL